MNDGNADTLAYWMRPSVIVGAALLLRLVWAAVCPVAPVSDGVLYDAFAQSIVAGHGYAFPDGTMTEYWPVGTSAIYALLYHIFGVRPWVIPVFQALLGASIVGLTWRLARHSMGPAVAAVAAWLTAVWPLLIEFTTILASELLFIALVLTALNIWISRRLPFAVRMITWGASIAAATYVRPTALPLLFIFPAMQWIVDRDWRALIMGFLLAGLTASLLFAPWTYRSVVLFDRMVLVSANGGVNLWMGNNPESTGGYMDFPDKKFPNEVDRDHYYGREAANFILSHPLLYAKLSIKRAITTYGRETIGVVWNERGLSSKYKDTSLVTLKRISTAYWWSLLILGFAGTVLVIRRRLVGPLWPVLTALAYFAVFPVLTVAMDRYHVPIDPMLAIFAAYALLRRSSVDTPNPSSTSTEQMAAQLDFTGKCAKAASTPSKAAGSLMFAPRWPDPG
jgi:dolichyl-phosphate-mannose-protein mannosyltransferase